jgi:sulfonate transport system substrate-binding protein
MTASFSPISRRGLLGAGLVAAAGAGLAVRVFRPGAGHALRVATYRGWTQAYLADAGVAPPPGSVSFADLGAGNFILEALLSDGVDYAEMSEIPPAFVLPQGRALRQIAVLRGDVNGQMLIVPRGSAVRDAGDLRGRRVGYVRATTSQVLLLRALGERGLGWHDIDAVALSPQDGLAAFRTGRLDAWAGLGVYLSIALSDGARILRSGGGLLSGNYVAVTSAMALADPRRRAAIVDYMRREQRTYAWIERNPDAWAVRNADQTGLPRALFLDAVRRRSAAFRLGPVDQAAVQSQQAVADLLAANGFLRGRVDVAPLWDRGFWASVG